SPNRVTPIIPAKTAVPSDCRISAPAPTAIVSGSTPKMNASDVIRIGRIRVRAAWTARPRTDPYLDLRLVSQIQRSEWRSLLLIRSERSARYLQGYFGPGLVCSHQSWRPGCTSER